MNRQHLVKRAGLALQREPYAVAEILAPVEPEQQPRHRPRNASDSLVRLLVPIETAFAHSGRKFKCLLEGKRQAFAGDGIDGTGSFTDQRDTSALYTTQATGRSNRAHGRALDVSAT